MLSTAGTQLIRDSNKVYEMHTLVTLPKYSGQGAGSMLVDWGKQRAQDRRLHVRVASMQQAVGFYKKMGFKTVGENEVGVVMMFLQSDLPGNIKGEDGRG